MTLDELLDLARDPLARSRFVAKHGSPVHAAYALAVGRNVSTGYADPTPNRSDVWRAMRFLVEGAEDATALAAAPPSTLRTLCEADGLPVLP